MGCCHHELKLNEAIEPDAPGLGDFSMDSDPPVMPDAEGRYPVATPGVSQAL